jgi:LysR family transcriptional activator of nhaA
MLVPNPANSVGKQLEAWLTRQQVHPRVVAEFDDTALMKAFGREGRGVFVSPTLLENETAAQYGGVVIGRTDEIVEEFFAITVERRISHPCVATITNAARGTLFGS